MWSYLPSWGLLKCQFALTSLCTTQISNFLSLLAISGSVGNVDKKEMPTFQNYFHHLIGWFPLQEKTLRFRPLSCNCLSMLNFKHMLIYRIQICLSNYFIAWVKPRLSNSQAHLLGGRNSVVVVPKSCSTLSHQTKCIFQIQKWCYSGIHGRYFCLSMLSWFQNGNFVGSSQGHLMYYFIINDYKFLSTTCWYILLTCFIYDTELMRDHYPKAVALWVL